MFEADAEERSYEVAGEMINELPTGVKIFTTTEVQELNGGELSNEIEAS